MKFHAKISEISVPYLWGPEDDKSYRSCHEFTVKNVKLQKKFMIYSSQSCPVKEIPSDAEVEKVRQPGNLVARKFLKNQALAESLWILLPHFLPIKQFSSNRKVLVLLQNGHIL